MTPAQLANLRIGDELKHTYLHNKRTVRMRVTGRNKQTVFLSELPLAEWLGGSPLGRWYDPANINDRRDLERMELQEVQP